MEENVSKTTQSNSVNGEKLLQTRVCMGRKRKLQAEELGVPPTKHKWISGNFASKYDYSSDADSDAVGVHRWEAGEESAKDSNSIAADADSTISVSNEADVGMDQGCFKECSSYWVGNSSKGAVNSLESRSAMKSSSTTMESSSMGKVDEFGNCYTELHSSMNFEEHLLEFGGHIDCSCLECRNSFEDYKEKEIEEILCANGVPPNNYVLSSGRLTLKQDAEPVPKKLTIDKEFEQYFSTLML